MSRTSRPRRIDPIARSCSRCRRPMPKRWRAICRTTSGPGRRYASSYPGSRVATLCLPRALARVPHPNRRARGPRGDANMRPVLGTARGGDLAVALDGTPIPFAASYPIRRGKSTLSPGGTGLGGRLRASAFPDRRTRRIRAMRAISGRLAALALAAGAGATRHVTLPAEPDVTLAAHRDHDGLVIDRLPDGATGLLVLAGRFHAGDAPDLTLEARGERRAALWMIGTSRVLVRESASTSAPRIGEVLSTWDGHAIRLTIYARDGSALRTDVFLRSDDGRGAPVLARGGPGATDRSG